MGRILSYRAGKRHRTLKRVARRVIKRNNDGNLDLAARKLPKSLRRMTESLMLHR